MDLNEKAVASRSGKDANEILMALLNSGVEMVQTFHMGANMQRQPQGTGAGDHLVKPR